MKVAVDTNVLVRAAVQDDRAQTRADAKEKAVALLTAHGQSARLVTEKALISRAR